MMVNEIDTTLSTTHVAKRQNDIYFTPQEDTYNDSNYSDCDYDYDYDWYTYDNDCTTNTKKIVEHSNNEYGKDRPPYTTTVPPKNTGIVSNTDHKHLATVLVPVQQEQEPKQHHHHHHQPQQQQQQQQLKHIELMPGYHLPVLGAQKTHEALQQKQISACHCLSCTLSLCCCQDAEYVLCPECYVVSPIHSFIKPRKVGLGVGFGVKTSELTLSQRRMLIQH
jgi:hypothetical protein